MSDDRYGSDDSSHHPPRDDLARRRSGKNGTNGSSPEGLGVRPVPMDDVRAEPLDLVAVQADDELINALAGGMSVSSPGFGGYGADDQVAAMLAAWKADVDVEPIPEIDLDVATAAVLAGRRPSGRARHLVPIASAAALIVVAITGVSIGAHDARPGDALFAVSKVLYAEEAASYEALDVVEQSAEKAKQALAVGDKDAAAAAVAQGQAAAETVLAEHGQGEAFQDLQKLEVAVEETIPGVPNQVEDEEAAPPQTLQGGTESSTTTPPSNSAASSDTAEPPVNTTSEPAQPGGGTDGSEDTPDGPPEEPRPEATGPGSEQPPGSSAGPAEQPGPTEPGDGPDSTSSGESPAGPPAPGESTADPVPPEPLGENTAARPTRTPPPTTTTPPPGISGASASATGTATPSGQPLAP